MKFRKWFGRWGFSIALVTLFSVIFFATLTVLEFRNAFRWEMHTHQVISQIRLSRTIIDQPNYNAQEVSTVNKVLRDLVKDNPEQVKRIEAFDQSVQKRVEKKLLYNQIQKIISEEIQLLNVRHEKSQSLGKISLFLVVLSNIFTILLTFAGWKTLTRASVTNQNQAILLKAIFDNLGDGLMVVDTHGKVIHINRAAEKLLGADVSQTAAKDRIQRTAVINARTGKPLTLEESPLTRSLKEGIEINNFETITTKTQTGPLTLSTDSRPIYGRDHVLLGALALFKDVTQQKFIEKETQRARETAVEASRLKSEFLATMSHEIRTPMNGVIGMATLLSDTSLDSAQRSYVETIESSAKALVGLINGILDHAKIESGHLILEKVDFDLNQLVKEVISTFYFMVQSKNLKLKCEIEKDVPLALSGDPDRLRQILVNLLGNSFKFTHEGEVKISIRHISTQEKIVRLRVEISDTGIGMSKEAQTHLFERFSRVHKDSEKYTGSGLGLMITKKLLKLMNGDIQVESTPGKGSKFWFTLEFGLASRGFSLKNGSGTFSSDDFLKGHILVAEDNPVNQAVVKSFIEKMGLTCEIYPNGKEALDAFLRNSSQYSALLIDCQMPIMNGYEATMKIREWERSSSHSRIPIIAFTAEGMSADKDKCFASGMDDIVLKPIDSEKFKRTLKHALADKHLPIFDSEVLQHLRKHDPDLDKLVIEEFLKAAPSDIGKILDCPLNSHDGSVKELAHGLKSGARTVGLLQLGQICEHIEMGAWGQIKDKEGLSRCFKDSQSALKTYLNQRDSKAG